MDESEAEMLLGLKPKPGTLVPVKSGRVCGQCCQHMADGWAARCCIRSLSDCRPHCPCAFPSRSTTGECGPQTGGAARRGASSLIEQAPSTITWSPAPELGSEMSDRCGGKQNCQQGISVIH